VAATVELALVRVKHAQSERPHQICVGQARVGPTWVAHVGLKGMLSQASSVSSPKRERLKEAYRNQKATNRTAHDNK